MQPAQRGIAPQPDIACVRETLERRLGDQSEVAMRVFASLCSSVLALALTSSSASAQAVKQTEVINFPDPQNVVGSVEVTNLPDAGGVSRFQFVGFSETQVDAVSGVFAWTRACNADFSFNVRACSTQEVVETSMLLSVLPAGQAWVRPTPNADVNRDLATGISSSNLHCGAWRGNTGGILMNELGQFLGGNDCTIAHSVACCAPIEGVIGRPPPPIP